MSVGFCSLPGQHLSWYPPQAEGTGSVQHTGTGILHGLSGENLSDNIAVFMGHSPTGWAHLHLARVWFCLSVRDNFAACDWSTESLSKARQGSHWLTQFSREVEVYTSLFLYNITPLIRPTGGCCTKGKQFSPQIDNVLPAFRQCSPRK